LFPRRLFTAQGIAGAGLDGPTKGTFDRFLISGLWWLTVFIQ
jgi:hypothetical protein